jgi:hypothetical protein
MPRRSQTPVTGLTRRATHTLGAAWLGWIGLVAPAVRAEVGVGPRSILIGQSAAFSGPSAELGREYRA